VTTQAQTIPFGEWLPDLPAHMNQGALIAENVVPQVQSYRGLNSLSSFSDALTAACVGTFWGQDDSNVVFNFAGDFTDLYRLDGGVTWTSVNRLVGGDYASSNWEYTKFGDRVIAANKADLLQYYDLNTSSEFDDLPGSPPKAKTIATVRDFVMLGDVDGLGPNFIQWSGFNNSELWTPSLATQADFQELFGRAGRVQRIVPGEFAIIFCEHSIFRADYAGPPIVFQIDEVERKRGTPSPNSVAWTGNHVYYFGWDGFYVFDGIKSTPISHNRVSKWFIENSADDARDTMRAAVDRINRLVIWAFKSSSSAVQNDRLVIYNWGADKWSYGILDTEIIDEFVSAGFALDDLDVPLPGGIDADSINVDSTQFLGGIVNLQAFNSSHEAATFGGVPLTSIIDTKEVSSGSAQRLVTNSVRPLVEGGPSTSITVQVGTRNSLHDNVNFSLAKATNGINGEVSCRHNSRYQRFRLNITGGFDHAEGARPSSRLSGGRR
jgi:hypothetical protein